MPPRIWKKVKIIIPLIVQIAYILTSFTISLTGAQISLKGFVKDESGAFLSGAKVYVWSGNDIANIETDSNGFFELPVDPDRAYTVYIYKDEEDTEGFDYLPSRKIVEPNQAETLTFVLFPAASILLKGDLQLVESEELPSLISYSVVEPSSMRLINISGFQLIYGLSPEAEGAFLDLKPSHIIVPADTQVNIRINCSVLIDSSLKEFTFVALNSSYFMLSKGEKLVLDVKSFVLPFTFQSLENMAIEAYEKIEEMRLFGFYLPVQKNLLENASKLKSEAEELYKKGGYTEAFTTSKRCYILLKNIINDLVTLYNEAKISVYILIYFLGFTSVAIAFLLGNRWLLKLLGSIIIHSILSTILFFIYPGSLLIPKTLFAQLGASSLLVSFFIAYFAPYFLKSKSSTGRVALRNMIIPVFSIAKRNLQRRKLRFVLTFTTITILVTCFVTFTSFSEGYGLNIRKISDEVHQNRDIIVRARGYNEKNPTFINAIDLNSGWIERQRETEVVSPKIENLPLEHPIADLDGIPLYGFVMINPELESKFLRFSEIVKEGEFSKEGGIMISENLRKKLNINIGDEIELNLMKVKIQGIFKDDAMRMLKDADGSPYLPRKLVNLNPPGELPNWVVVECEPDEIIIASTSESFNIPLTGVSRIGIIVEESFDPSEFAKRLALERGYSVWVNSDQGLFYMQLSGYFEGKGVPLFIPWIIVVLNVVATMLNSMYERRSEIGILSSIGLNPSQISSIFIAEASIIGVAAGGVGYITGLSFYKLMNYFNIALDVHQKVSAIWSIAALGLAMVSILVGALFALKRSTVITPSLTRRWSMPEEDKKFSEPWIITLPVKILPEEADGFVGFLLDSLRERENMPLRQTSSIKVSKRACDEVKIDFVYKEVQTMLSNFYSKNSIILTNNQGIIQVRLISYGNKESVHETGSMIRFLVMEWSTKRV
ncbi:FtsX-like permease family protein [Candidatus Bathyarchaeota archaeon]|nr:FtsX-like permease family protein [Candidatus Bathyarchaeota archaeon]MBS7630482.1 FtsX-like permease family protein [Candidatus Bathyarchaeota archaeon]